MAKTIIDKFSIEELQDIVKKWTSWRQLCKAIGYNSHSSSVINRI